MNYQPTKQPTNRTQDYHLLIRIRLQESPRGGGALLEQEPGWTGSQSVSSEEMWALCSLEIKPPCSDLGGARWGSKLLWGDYPTLGHRWEFQSG